MHKTWRFLLLHNLLFSALISDLNLVPFYLEEIAFKCENRKVGANYKRRPHLAYLEMPMSINVISTKFAIA